MSNKLAPLGYSRNPEGIPVTFQIGMVGSDGVVLASDMRVLNFQGHRTTEHTQKIICPSGQPVLYCWSGDEHPGEVGAAFCECLKTNKFAETSVRDLLVTAAENVWTDNYGKRRTRAIQKVVRERHGGTLMLACRGEFGVELWAQDYQSRMNPHLIRDKSFATEAGDDRNAAIFFFERYYQNDRKINELLLRLPTQF